MGGSSSCFAGIRCENIQIVITEKLSDDIKGSQKKVFRGRILPHKGKVDDNNDPLVGGIVTVPKRSICQSQLEGMRGGRSVVLTLAEPGHENAMKRESQIMQELTRRCGDQQNHRNILSLLVPCQQLRVSTAWSCY